MTLTSSLVFGPNVLMESVGGCEFYSHHHLKDTLQTLGDQFALTFFVICAELC